MLNCVHWRPSQSCLSYNSFSIVALVVGKNFSGVWGRVYAYTARREGESEAYLLATLP